MTFISGFVSIAYATGTSSHGNGLTAAGGGGHHATLPLSIEPE